MQNDLIPSPMSRRGFLAGSAGFVAALGAPSVLRAAGLLGNPNANESPEENTRHFPKGFWWGSATAAYQIEGAAAEDGRKPSVWDTFSRMPGRTKNGDTGDVACDHYHRFPEDVKLLSDLGVKHYRFSISWPRIIPEGRGAVNEKGIDFYKRLVDALLAHGITPHATLFHWDSPQALEDLYGSWRSREMAKDFADYCTATVKRLGDRIHYWMTLNEIACFTYMGYGVGKMPVHAPGTIVSSQKEVQQTVHHALLAHGLGCQAIRAASPEPCHVSIVSNFSSYVPVIETPENIRATMKAFVSEKDNATMLMPILTGQYDPKILEQLGPDAPEIQPEDMKNIGQPLDALGWNVYSGAYVRAADTEKGYEILPMPKDYPVFLMPWLKNVPDCVYWGIRSITDAAGKKDLPIFISENGAAADDVLTDKEEVLDLERILFMRTYLQSATRSLNEGYPLKGYFYWSLLDNFEWAWGYTRRFGLCYMDYKSLRRIPKLSYHWYQHLIKEHVLA